MGQEQRTENRVNVHWPAHATRGNRAELNGYIKNISWGGAQYEVPEACNKGEILLIEVNALYKTKVYKFRVLAEVMYDVLKPNNMHAMGVKFRKREAEADQFFRKFLGAPLPRPAATADAPAATPSAGAETLPPALE